IADSIQKSPDCKCSVQSIQGSRVIVKGADGGIVIINAGVAQIEKGDTIVPGVSAVATEKPAVENAEVLPTANTDFLLYGLSEGESLDNYRAMDGSEFSQKGQKIRVILQNTQVLDSQGKPINAVVVNWVDAKNPTKIIRSIVYTANGAPTPAKIGTEKVLTAAAQKVEDVGAWADGVLMPTVKGVEGKTLAETLQETETSAKKDQEAAQVALDASSSAPQPENKLDTALLQRRKNEFKQYASTVSNIKKNIDAKINSVLESLGLDTSNVAAALDELQQRVAKLEQQFGAIDARVLALKLTIKQLGALTAQSAAFADEISTATAAQNAVDEILSQQKSAREKNFKVLPVAPQAAQSAAIDAGAFADDAKALSEEVSKQPGVTQEQMQQATSIAESAEKAAQEAQILADKTKTKAAEAKQKKIEADTLAAFAEQGAFSQERSDAQQKAQEVADNAALESVNAARAAERAANVAEQAVKQLEKLLVTIGKARVEAQKVALETAAKTDAQEMQARIKSALQESDPAKRKQLIEGIIANSRVKELLAELEKLDPIRAQTIRATLAGILFGGIRGATAPASRVQEVVDALAKIDLQIATLVVTSVNAEERARVAQQEAKKKQAELIAQKAAQEKVVAEQKRIEAVAKAQQEIGAREAARDLAAQAQIVAQNALNQVKQNPQVTPEQVLAAEQKVQEAKQAVQVAQVALNNAVQALVVPVAPVVPAQQAQPLVPAVQPAVPALPAQVPVAPVPVAQQPVVPAQAPRVLAPVAQPVAPVAQQQVPVPIIAPAQQAQPQAPALAPVAPAQQAQPQVPVQAPVPVAQQAPAQAPARAPVAVAVQLEILEARQEQAQAKVDDIKQKIEAVKAEQIQQDAKQDAQKVQDLNNQQEVLVNALKVAEVQANEADAAVEQNKLERAQQERLLPAIGPPVAEARAPSPLVSRQRSFASRVASAVSVGILTVVATLASPIFSSVAEAAQQRLVSIQQAQVQTPTTQTTEQSVSLASAQTQPVTLGAQPLRSDAGVISIDVVQTIGSFIISLAIGVSIGGIAGISGVAVAVPVSIAAWNKFVKPLFLPKQIIIKVSDQEAKNNKIVEQARIASVKNLEEYVLTTRDNDAYKKPGGTEGFQGAAVSKLTSANIENIFEKKYTSTWWGKAVVVQGPDGTWHPLFWQNSLEIHHKDAIADLIMKLYSSDKESPEYKMALNLRTAELPAGLYKSDPTKKFDVMLLAKVQGFEFQYNEKTKQLTGFDVSSSVRKEYEFLNSKSPIKFSLEERVLKEQIGAVQNAISPALLRGVTQAKLGAHPNFIIKNNEGRIITDAQIPLRPAPEYSSETALSARVRVLGTDLKAALPGRNQLNLELGGTVLRAIYALGKFFVGLVKDVTIDLYNRATGNISEEKIELSPAMQAFMNAVEKDFIVDAQTTAQIKTLFSQHEQELLTPRELRAQVAATLGEATEFKLRNQPTLKGATPAQQKIFEERTKTQSTSIAISALFKTYAAIRAQNGDRSKTVNEFTKYLIVEKIIAQNQVGDALPILAQLEYGAMNTGE
ncbi:MAG: hypothetical protein Q7K43_00365, partial [Candidatus Woesearchaeota archaeon]|nr:hypothetical protein [Candidatus Woesearchaeota archaeon]